TIISPQYINMYVKYDRYDELVFHNCKFFSTTLKNALLALLLTANLGCIDPDFGELLVLHRRYSQPWLHRSRFRGITRIASSATCSNSGIQSYSRLEKKYLKKTEPPALKQQKIDDYFNEL